MTESNKNFLQPSGFSVLIDRQNYPNLQFFAKSISHPSVDLSPVEQPVRRARIPYAGDTVTFGALDITFLIDEDMETYIEMYNWMVRIVNENQRGQSEAIQDEAIPTEADIVVNVLTSHNNTNRIIKYMNCVPTSVSGMELSADASTEPVVFNGTFSFKAFEIT